MRGKTVRYILQKYILGYFGNQQKATDQINNRLNEQQKTTDFQKQQISKTADFKNSRFQKQQLKNNRLQRNHIFKNNKFQKTTNSKNNKFQKTTDLKKQISNQPIKKKTDF